MSGLATEHISAVETGQMSSVETGQMPAVSTADICPVSTPDVLGGDENDFASFFTPKLFNMEFIRRSPGFPGGARQNGRRSVETESHQPRTMGRIVAVN